MILAYDSARPKLIPANPPAIFPYADGHFHWSNTEYPEAQFRYITVQGNPGIDIADFEPGCIWPGSALRRWAEKRHAAGHPDLTVYTDRSNYDAAEAAMTGFAWHLFLATLDGSKFTSWKGRPVRAVQFTDRLNEYDISEVYDTHWLNVPKA